MSFEKSGTVTVKTVSAGGAIPVPMSNVRIRGQGSESSDVVLSVFTDINGLSMRIPLPAPSAYLSEAPYPASEPYGLYDISVVKDGYYTKKYKNVAVFDGQDTFLTVEMIPRDIHGDASYPKDVLNTDQMKRSE